MVRLFVALELNEAIKTAVRRLQEKLARTCDGVKWTPPEQVHLTVKFLGDVADDQVTDVADAVRRAAARSPAFTLILEGCGCFPPGGPVRILWVGAREDGGRLSACVCAVEEEMERMGFARETRPFTAHGTVGRVRDDRSRGAIRSAFAAAAFGPWTIELNTLTLMSSVLAPKGPTYAPVCRARLLND
jgi:2'-5' RNA ligase